MNNLQIFKNNEFGEIRAIMKDGKPWFVGKDIADKLGYQNGSRDINRHVDEEDKTIEMMPQYQNGTVVGSSKTISINESGLYSLILSSKLPTAKKFKRWVTSEVLPSIRKNGIYATDELLENPDLIIKLATKLKHEKEENKVLQLENKMQTQQINELKPKADYADIILKNKGLITVTQIAKDYGMSAKGLNKLLHELKIQYKQSDQWLLYAKYQDKGYTHSKTIDILHKDGKPDIKMNTKWTQKGRLFLYNLLKNENIYPVIERQLS